MDNKNEHTDENDKTPRNYEVSSGELASLLRAFGSALITDRHGSEIEANLGTESLTSTDPASKFVKPLEYHLIRSIYHKDDDDVIVQPGGYVTYNARHYLEQEEGEQRSSVYESMMLRYDAQIVGNPIVMTRYITIESIGGIFSGSSSVEFVDMDGNVIGGEAKLPDEGLAPISAQDVSFALAEALDHPLYDDDVAKLREVLEYVAS